MKKLLITSRPFRPALIAFALLLGLWLFQPLEVKAQSVMQGETLQRQDEQEQKQQDLERRADNFKRRSETLQRQFETLQRQQDLERRIDDLERQMQRRKPK